MVNQELHDWQELERYADLLELHLCVSDTGMIEIRRSGADESVAAVSSIPHLRAFLQGVEYGRQTAKIGENQ